MKTMYLPRISISLLFLALFACLSSEAWAAPTVHTWTGAGDGVHWSDNNNWTGGRPFTDFNDGTIVQFNGVAGKKTSVCDVSVEVNQIQFTGTGNEILGDGDPGHSLSLRGAFVAVNLTTAAGVNTIGGTTAGTALKFILTGTAQFWTLASGSTLNLPANISGDSTLDVTALGATISVQGDNSFSQELVLNSGTLLIESSSVDGKTALLAPVTLGTAGGAANTAVMRLTQSNVVGVVDIVVNASGWLDLNAQTDVIGGLQVNAGGRVTLGGGTLTTNGDVSLTGVSLDLGNGTWTFANPLQLLGDSVVKIGENLPGILNINAGLSMVGGIIQEKNSGKAQPDMVNFNGEGFVTATSSATGLPTSVATIKCKVTLNNTVRSFNVTDGPTALDFVIDGQLTEGSVVGSGIRKNEDGVMKIKSSVANTFTGVTTVDRGTLVLENTGGLAIPGQLIVGNAADVLNRAIIKDLANNQILNDNTKPPTINKSGQVNVNGFSEAFPSIAGTGSVNLDGDGGNGSFTFGGDNADTAWGGVISGAGSFIKIGTGTFTFTGTSTSSGEIDVLGGKMLVGTTTANNQSLSAKLVIGPGTGSPATLANCVTVELQRANLIPDATAVVVNSDGLLTLKGFSDVVGAVTVNGGAVGGVVDIGSAQFEVTGGLTLNNGQVLATNAGNLVQSSDVAASSSVSLASVINAPVALKSTAKFTVTGGGLQPALTIAGIISNGNTGPRGLTKAGPGTLAIEGTNGNTYTGTTTVELGVMTLHHTTGSSIIGPVVIGNAVDAADSAVLRALTTDQYGAGATFTINASGTLDSTNRSETVSSLASTGGTGGKVVMGTGTLTIDTSSVSAFDGVISGSGGLVKLGTGTQGLGGVNLFSGTTAVSAGALLVNGALPNSAVSVGAGGTLGGTGIVQMVAANTATSAVRPGALTGGSLQVAGNLNMAGGNLAIGIDDSTAQKSNRMAVAGMLDISNATLNFNVNGTAGQAVYLLASFASKTGEFLNPSLPPGYMLTYTFDTHLNNQVTNKNIALIIPVLTSAPSGVSGGAATLHGSATLTGKAATAYFEYGIGNAFNLTTPVQDLGTGTYSVPLDVLVKGLSPASTYKYRLVVVTEDGTVRGAEQSFSTPDSPIVATLPATTITASSAKFNGTVDGGGRSARYFFQYGETTAYGLSTKFASVASASPVPVGLVQAGLFGGRTYHYRIVGTLETSAAPVNLYYGDDATFTTLGPVVSTQPATAIASLSATANGTVNPQGKATTVYFEYGLTATGAAVQTYTLKTAVQAVGSGSSAVGITAPLKPLGFNKSYSFRIVATNANGVSRGDTQVFTTHTVLPPHIATPPSPKLASLGAPVTFSVVVTEAVPTDSVPTYKWRKNGVAVAGATSANYTIPAVTIANAGNYDCVVTNAAGSVTTAPTVALGVVDTASKSLNLAAAATATMAVNNSVTGLSFAWKKGVALDPVTPDGSRITTVGKTLTIKTLVAGDAPAGDSNTYTCEVTGAAFPGQKASAVFTLKVFSDGPVIPQPHPVVMPEGIVSGTYNINGFNIPVDPSSSKVPTSYAAVGLPAGLKLNTVTGLISGKPTVASKPVVGSPGTFTPFNITLKAINSKGTATAPATLIVKPLPALAVGTFNGLVDRDAEAAPTLTKGYGGKVTVTVPATGAFSGTIGLGALSYPFTGVMDAATGSTTSTSTVTIKRTAPLPSLTLALTFHGDTGKLDGTVTDGVIAAPIPLSGWVNPWNATTNKVPVAVATKYTAMLDIEDPDLIGTDPATNPPGDPANIRYPQGNGFTTVTVAAAGTVTWVGKMADGIIPATYSTTMAADGSIPVHLMLYTNTGSAHGWVTAKADSVATPTNGGLSLLDGTVDWNKTPQVATSKDLVYKAGIPKHNLMVVGGAYVAPTPAKTPVLGLTDTGVKDSTNAHLVFLEGGIKDVAAVAPDLPFIKGSAMAANLDLQVRVTTGNVGVFPTGSNPALVTLTIAPATGLMSGGFTLKDNDPTDATPPIAVLSRPGTYSGVIVNRVGVKKGIGFFLLQELPVVGPPKTTLAVMPKLSGQVILEPGL